MGVTNSNKLINTDRIPCGGTLRVTLALTAAPDIISNPTDIVLILDRSGSMIGALLCGLVYRKTKMLIPTVIGEVFGTGILGALAAYPLATFFLSQEAAVFGFVIPFGVSSFGGALISLVILLVLQRTRALDQLQKSLSSR